MKKRTLNFSKYAGKYSVKEAEEVSKKITDDIFEQKKSIALQEAKNIYGDGFTYELKEGKTVILGMLEGNQRVCASGLKGYYILMTKIEKY